MVHADLVRHARRRPSIRPVTMSATKVDMRMEKYSGARRAIPKKRPLTDTPSRIN